MFTILIKLYHPLSKEDVGGNIRKHRKNNYDAIKTLNGEVEKCPAYEEMKNNAGSIFLAIYKLDKISYCGNLQHVPSIYQ